MRVDFGRYREMVLRQRAHASEPWVSKLLTACQGIRQDLLISKF